MDIGTQRAENLVHLRVFVLVNHDAGRGLDIVAGNSHIGNNGQVGQTRHILMTFNLIAEQVDEPNEEQGDGEGQHHGSQQDNQGLGADFSFEERLIDEFALISSGSKCNAVLLALLQEQQIDTRFHILLTTNLVEHAFLYRGARDATLVFAILEGNTLTVDVGRAAGLQQGSLDTSLQTVDGFCQRHHLWGLLAGSRQQAVAVLNSLIVAGNELGGGSVSQTDIGGNDVIFILGIVDMFAEIVEHLDL